MEAEYLRRYLNKKVHLINKDGLHYNGKIVEVGDDSIVFLDKFNKELLFDFDAIRELHPLEDDAQ